MNAGAQSNWRASSGLNITQVTLDKYNNTIDSLNTLVDSNFNGGIPTSNLDKMDNIDKVPLLFVGAETDLNDKYSLEVQYENIFGEVEQTFSSALDSTENKGTIEVDLKGAAGFVNYRMSENWKIGGGIGFYNGTKNVKLDGTAYTAAGLARDEEYDLSAVSYRAGLDYYRDFAQNWTFNGGIDYLYMELDDEEYDSDVYSSGFSYTAGVIYKF